MIRPQRMMFRKARTRNPNRKRARDDGTGDVDFIVVAEGGVQPSYHAYTEGDRLDSHPDYTALTSTANYESTIGATITTAEFLVDGTAQLGSYIVQARESITLNVEDNQIPANVRKWTIETSVDYIAPTLDTAASITGFPVAGDTLTGVPATFTGTDVAINNMWRESTDGVAFINTGNTTTTSPVVELGKYYDFVSLGSNPAGNGGVWSCW